MHRIAASILSADRRRLPDELRRLVAAGVDAVHLNVRGAEDRSNLDLGHLSCAAIRTACALPVQVHLRVPASRALIHRFAEASADLVIVQWAPGQDTAALLDRVRAAGCQAGLAFDPGDPREGLGARLPRLGLVHVSCAWPASATRDFVHASLAAIHHTRALIAAGGRPVRLQADVDIGPANVAAAAAAGVDDIVIGRALFGANDRAAMVRRLRDALDLAQTGPVAA
ncbi:MAG TPA: hypothetical protein PK306_17730 [Aquabacterium sp.]|nr:hypothetical protein [Aquabacterium sp.]HQC97545.1 hypothetical protein [Aquabacterium sp.]